MNRLHTGIIGFQVYYIEIYWNRPIRFKSFELRNPSAHLHSQTSFPLIDYKLQSQLWGIVGTVEKFNRSTLYCNQFQFILLRELLDVHDCLRCIVSCDATSVLSRSPCLTMTYTHRSQQSTIRFRSAMPSEYQDCQVHVGTPANKKQTLTGRKYG